jgi:hypothetical protein
MEALASLGYEAAGKIPAALLNWILHFNPNNEEHVHQMVSMDSSYNIFGGADPLHFHCYTCCTKYTLRVLNPRPRMMGNDYTCPERPVHHLHIYIASEKLMEPSNPEIEIRCCSCHYHAILSYESPPIPKDIMNAFLKSLGPKKSGIDTLNTLRNLLREASYCGEYGMNWDNEKIINILQNEHGV